MVLVRVEIVLSEDDGKIHPR